MKIPGRQRGRYFGTRHSPYKCSSAFYGPLASRSYKGYEVFFRHVFTSAYPHRENNAYTCDLVLPVYRLSHVTHNREAALITERKGFFTFRPKRKVGKAYERDGSPLGESFRDDFLTGLEQVPVAPDKQTYRFVPRSESLLPEGYYSWWGVTTTEWLADNRENSALCREPYRPFYLQQEPSSLYGNHEFSGELHEIILSYRHAHSSLCDSDSNKPDVYLLLGGTLRYTKEICCVVIVCTEYHRHSEALRDYLPLPVGANINPHHPTLVLRGLTDNRGKVVDYSGWCIPEFHPKHISSATSWANLAFAFYFDSSNAKFELQNLWHRPIDHKRCIRKQPSPYKGKWVCPNDLPDDLRTTQVQNFLVAVVVCFFIIFFTIIQL